MSTSSRVQSKAQLRAQSKKQRPAKRESRVLPIAILLIIASYAIYLLVSAQVEIRDKRNELDQIEARLFEVRTANAELERYLSNDDYLDDYMELIARGRLSYAHPRERIYFIMPSS